MRILKLDSRASLDWDGYSSFTQTYTDLFATPGWQASEFRLALRDMFLSGRDGDQKDEKDAREIVALLRDGARAHGSVSVLLDATGGELDSIPEHGPRIRSPP